MFRISQVISVLAAAIALSIIGGCAGAKVDATKTSGPLAKPDMIIVHNFAVTPGEVKLDEGLLATTMRDDKNREPNAEEKRVGYLVSEKLASSLVQELRDKGINAVRPGGGVQATDTTVTLNGEFLNIDQGNQSERVWVGFGMGGSEIRTRIQAVQNGQLVAQADTKTKSSLKPGMLASAGTAAAAESGAALAVGAATTGLSESFLATVDADAKRTAKEVAERIHKAYVNRGWLAE
jgi:hypothetical protein